MIINKLKLNIVFNYKRNPQDIYEKKPSSKSTFLSNNNHHYRNKELQQCHEDDDKTLQFLVVVQSDSTIKDLENEIKTVYNELQKTCSSYHRTKLEVSYSSDIYLNNDHQLYPSGTNYLIVSNANSDATTKVNGTSIHNNINRHLNDSHLNHQEIRNTKNGTEKFSLNKYDGNSQAIDQTLKMSTQTNTYDSSHSVVSGTNTPTNSTVRNKKYNRTFPVVHVEYFSNENHLMTIKNQIGSLLPLHYVVDDCLKDNDVVYCDLISLIPEEKYDQPEKQEKLNPLDRKESKNIVSSDSDDVVIIEEHKKQNIFISEKQQIEENLKEHGIPKYQKKEIANNAHNSLAISVSSYLSTIKNKKTKRILTSTPMINKTKHDVNQKQHQELGSDQQNAEIDLLDMSINRIPKENDVVDEMDMDSSPSIPDDANTIPTPSKVVENNLTSNESTTINENVQSRVQENLIMEDDDQVNVNTEDSELSEEENEGEPQEQDDHICTQENGYSTSVFTQHRHIQDIQSLSQKSTLLESEEEENEDEEEINTTDPAIGYVFGQDEDEVEMNVNEDDEYEEKSKEDVLEDENETEEVDDEEEHRALEIEPKADSDEEQVEEDDEYDESQVNEIEASSDDDEEGDAEEDEVTDENEAKEDVEESDNDEDEAETNLVDLDATQVEEDDVEYDTQEELIVEETKFKASPSLSQMNRSTTWTRPLPRLSNSFVSLSQIAQNFKSAMVGVGSSKHYGPKHQSLSEASSSEEISSDNDLSSFDTDSSYDGKENNCSINKKQKLINSKKRRRSAFSELAKAADEPEKQVPQTRRNRLIKKPNPLTSPAKKRMRRNTMDNNKMTVATPVTNRIQGNPIALQASQNTVTNEKWDSSTSDEE